MSSLHGRSGGLSWSHPVRWWPETPEWVGRQLYERDQAVRKKEINEKNRIKERELYAQQQEDARRFATESRTHTGNDAWSDEETDEGLGSVAAQRTLLAREEEIKQQRKGKRFVEKTHAMESVSVVEVAQKKDTNLWSNLSSSDDDWENDSDEDDNVFTDTHPNTLAAAKAKANAALSGDGKIAGSITNETVCELCDTDLSIEAGLTNDSTIDEIRAANVDIPKCRQCCKIVCRKCAKNWAQSNRETGKQCPFCRVKGYLDEHVFARKQLKGAGFTDDEKNVLILRQVGGNVNQAIAILLDENENNSTKKEEK